MVKTCPNGPKVLFLLIKTYLSDNWPKVLLLLIKTYFSEYLRLERSPAARRCACVYIVLFVTCSLVAYVSIFYLNGSKYLFTLLS